MVAVVLAASCAGGGGSSSSASCVPPYIDARASTQPGGDTSPEPTVPAGESITFHGHAYFADCHDTGEDATPTPIERVDIVVELPGGDRTDMGHFEPDAQGTFSFTVDVPADTEPGEGRIFDGRGAGHPFQVTGA